jgi:ABC-2 type transport system ATP-binding protein
MNPPIEIRALSKVFRRRRTIAQWLPGSGKKPRFTWALREVTLEVSEGEVLGLLGPNGAGKTTLLKILSGLVLPTSGVALVGGDDTRGRGSPTKRMLGFVTSDERSFYWRLTGKENLQFFGSLYQLSGAMLKARIAYLMDRLEMSEEADKPFGDYSSGMKQRLAVARALLHDPPILLLDEPTRSLDPISAKHLRRFLAEELNVREGKTLLLATHNLQEAEQLCRRVAILSGGQIQSVGRVEELSALHRGSEEYVFVLSGLDSIPSPWQDELTISPLPGNRVRVAGRFPRDGERLSDFLETVLRLRGRVVSCARAEPSLQEVFDRMPAGGP